MTTGVLQIRQIVLYVLLWIAMSVIHFSVLMSFYNISWLPAIGDSLVFNFIYAIIGIGLWFAVPYLDLSKHQWYGLLSQHFTGLVLVSMVWVFGSTYLLGQLFSGNQSYIRFLDNSQTIRFITGIFYYAVLVSIFYMINTYQQLQERHAREAQLYAQLKEAELSLLRSQIRPHFLFNSLNSISSLTMTNPPKAQEMIIKLSEFMRYSLNFPDNSLSTLEKELYHIQLYLDIEKIRFGEKLQFTKEVDSECLQIPLPAMILQPLLENAVKYGVYESMSTSYISLKMKCSEKMLNISIENDFDPDNVYRKGTGTGLRNVEKRLQTHYGQPGLLFITKKEKVFIVEMKIPRHVTN